MRARVTAVDNALQAAPMLVFGKHGVGDRTNSVWVIERPNPQKNVGDRTCLSSAYPQAWVIERCLSGKFWATNLHGVGRRGLCILVGVAKRG